MQTLYSLRQPADFHADRSLMTLYYKSYPETCFQSLWSLYIKSKLALAKTVITNSTMMMVQQSSRPVLYNPQLVNRGNSILTDGTYHLTCVLYPYALAPVSDPLSHDKQIQTSSSPCCSYLCFCGSLIMLLLDNLVPCVF